MRAGFRYRASNRETAYSKCCVEIKTYVHRERCLVVWNTRSFSLKKKLPKKMLQPSVNNNESCNINHLQTSWAVLGSYCFWMHAAPAGVLWKASSPGSHMPVEPAKRTNKPIANSWSTQGWFCPHTATADLGSSLLVQALCIIYNRGVQSTFSIINSSHKQY